MLLHILLLICIIYIGLFRSFFLKRHKFKCLRCGRCCRFKLKLLQEDIIRLEKAGKKELIIDGVWVKRIDGRCAFLENTDDGTRCAVYEARPETCRWWPVRKYWVDVRCKVYDRKLI